jgi:beta-phosphoglucomutase
MDNKMFDAAIFDWDGTLANTKKVIVASFQRALSEINCNTNDKLIERLIGIGSAETFKEILRFKNTNFDDALIEFLVRKKVQNSIELSSEIKLFDGAKDLLRNLENEIKLGLASMNKRKFIDYLLQKFGLAKLFDIIVTADEVKKAKPDPEIFLKCAKKMQVTPERCIVFEDSVFGIKAAKNSGMSCIAVLTGVYSRNEIEPEFPDMIVNSLTENKKIFDFIFQ